MATIPSDFFEGPEKVLQIQFFAKSVDSPRNGLRVLERSVWESLLEGIGCAILSSIHNDHIDAYVLSESSLFIFSHKLIIKTCGTISLLTAIPEIMDIGNKLGLGIEDVVFNRKNFFVAEQQPHPHRSFSDEVKYLDSHFTDGYGHIFGSVNSSHYNMYNASNSISTPSFQIKKARSTLELLMTGLDQQKMKIFHKMAGISAEQVTQDSGIGDLIPGTTIDAFVFDPCGYSCNAILDDGYFTIHITPQPSCSFASFETNILPNKNFTSLIEAVLAIFCPRDIIITHLSSKGKKIKRSNVLNKLASLAGFRSGFNKKALVTNRRLLNDSIFNLANYNLQFCQYQNPEIPLLSKL